MWHVLKKAARELRLTFGEAGGSYRPDLHYMRGPGPKWQAKYGALATTSPAAPPARPVLREGAERRT
jgi:hypothetical protein